MYRTRMAAFAALLFAGAATAQMSQEAPADFFVPIHTAQADPQSGDYGIWTAGNTFKASFHDGFVFYPLLGAAYEKNLPLRLTTESIRVGDTEIATAAPFETPRYSDWRFESARGGVTEVYDVRRDGIEQSFVIARRPQASGKLVVTIRTDTELTAPVMAARHGSLVFADAKGKELVDYGAATAIDAYGVSYPMTTSFDGTRIRLELDAATLSEVAFPLTVDPVIQLHYLSKVNGADKVVRESGIVWNDEWDNFVVTASRQFSRTDYDGYAWVVKQNHTDPKPIFLDVSASYSTLSVKPAFVAATNRYAIVFNRHMPALGATGIRAYVHNHTSTVVNSGRVIVRSVVKGEFQLNPQIGGTAAYSTGDGAAIVWQQNQSGTSLSRIKGLIVDTRNYTFGSEFELGSALVMDREYPSISRTSLGGDGEWVAVWQERSLSNASDDSDILGQRITRKGKFGAPLQIAPTSATPKHRVRPQVDGQDGRYFVTYVRTNGSHTNLGNAIGATRFDWPQNLTSPKIIKHRTLASRSTTTLSNAPVSYDYTTRSHWCVPYRLQGTTSSLRVMRVGHSGGILEDAAVGFGDPQAIAVDYHDDRGEFVISWTNAANKTTNPLVVSRFAHVDGRRVTAYGQRCGGTIGANSPYSGSEFFAITLSSVADAARNRPAFLLIGAGRISAELSAVGMAGCYLNVLPIVTLPWSVSTNPTTEIRFPLADDNALRGTLNFQWLYVDPSTSTTVKLRTTYGLEVMIQP